MENKIETLVANLKTAVEAVKADPESDAVMILREAYNNLEDEDPENEALAWAQKETP